MSYYGFPAFNIQLIKPKMSQLKKIALSIYLTEREHRLYCKSLLFKMAIPFNQQPLFIL